MNTQNLGDQPGHPQPSTRRSALLLTLLLSALLLILVSAHYCVARDWEHLTDGDGDYWGSTFIATGWDGPHTDKIIPRTSGIEWCLPDWVNFDVDWDQTFVFFLGDDSDKPADLTVSGSGGYGTGLLDCLFSHQLWWGAEWKWDNHGTEEYRSSNHCLVLGGPSTCWGGGLF